MRIESENEPPESQAGPTTAPSVEAGESSVADSAMATGSDGAEMTIADKHAGESVPDPGRDGELSPTEAARLLGDDPKNNRFVTVGIE